MLTSRLCVFMGKSLFMKNPHKFRRSHSKTIIIWHVGRENHLIHTSNMICATFFVMYWTEVSKKIHTPSQIVQMFFYFTSSPSLEDQMALFLSTHRMCQSVLIYKKYVLSSVLLLKNHIQNVFVQNPYVNTLSGFILREPCMNIYLKNKSIITNKFSFQNGMHL